MVEEAAFVASYALSLGAHPTGDTAKVTTVDGPASEAVWQIMGTLGSWTPDPSAIGFKQTAAYALAHAPELTSNNYLTHVYIFIPTVSQTNLTYNSSAQRFISAYSDTTLIQQATPEPGTMIFLGTGVLLIALSRIRRRR